MRRWLLRIFAVLSLVLLAVLWVGIFSHNDIGFLHNVVGGPTPHALDLELGLDRGRVEFLWEHWKNPPPGGPIPTGTHVYWHHFRFAEPDLRRTLWEFDAHLLSTHEKGLKVYLVAFPIWCAALPCLILPLIWLRKKRRPTQLSAFPVVLTADTKTASKLAG